MSANVARRGLFLCAAIFAVLLRTCERLSVFRKEICRAAQDVIWGEKLYPKSAP